MKRCKEAGKKKEEEKLEENPAPLQWPTRVGVKATEYRWGYIARDPHRLSASGYS